MAFQIITPRIAGLVWMDSDIGLLKRKISLSRELRNPTRCVFIFKSCNYRIFPVACGNSLVLL